MSMQSNYPRPNLTMKDAEPCPECGQPAGKRVRYTWWGGALGPAMMTLTKCQACGYQFNGKTGKSTKTAILVYNLVGFGVAIVVIAAMYITRA